MPETHSGELRGIKFDDERIAFVHDRAREAELGMEITNAVAHLADVPHRRVAGSLAASVDFDALDRLFRPHDDGSLREGGQLVLYLEGCEVTVRSDGFVTVERDE